MVKIPKCQIRNFKEPFWRFEMALNKVKQLVSEPHELFFYPINSISSILRFCGILTCVFVIKKHSQMAL